MQKHPHYEALIEMKCKAFENKSEFIGRCGGDEKNKWPRRTDKSWTLKTHFFIWYLYKQQMLYTCIIRLCQISSISYQRVFNNSHHSILFCLIYTFLNDIDMIQSLFINQINGIMQYQVEFNLTAFLPPTKQPPHTQL